MKKMLPLVLFLALLGAAGYWWFGTGGKERLAELTSAPSEGTRIIGSGTLEAEEISIASQLGGRIVSVAVDEGDTVRLDQTLVRLDATDFAAGEREAEAALVTAKADLANASAGPRPEEAAIARAELVEAGAVTQTSQAIWKQAQLLVADPQDLRMQLDDLKAQLAAAQRDVEAAQAAQKMAEIDRDEALRNQNGDAALTQQAISQKTVDAATVGLRMAEAQCEALEAQIQQQETIVAYPVQLVVQANQAGSAFRLAEANVQMAQAKLAAAVAEPRPVDVAVAQARVRQAQAALDKIQISIEMLTLKAPSEGIITGRSANVGELASPGAVLMTLGNLDEVTMKVFVPETQIGRVREGQPAHITVDAYPGRVFEGAVTYVAPKAEFTPKNVQTQEERVNLVFAVKIRLDNPEHVLKPGMPGDAEILTEL